MSEPDEPAEVSLDKSAAPDEPVQAAAKAPAKAPVKAPAKAPAKKAPAKKAAAAKKAPATKAPAKRAPARKAADEDPGDRAARLEQTAAQLLAEAKAERAAAAPAHEPRRTSGAMVAAAITGTLLVVAVVVGALWIVRLDNRNDDLAAKYAKARSAAAGSAPDARRAGSLAAAKQYAIDFASFDYQHLDADFAKVTAHLTPGFANSYQGVAAKLKATVVELKGRSTATVQAAAVQSVTDTTATVLLFVDQSITPAQSSTPRIDRQRMEMSLVRSKGTWLVDKLVLV